MPDQPPIINEAVAQQKFSCPACGAAAEWNPAKQPLVGLFCDLSESAALGCFILLTSDEHLRAVDFQRLGFELAAFDLTAPVIATPREIVRKFFR